MLGICRLKWKGRENREKIIRPNFANLWRNDSMIDGMASKQKTRNIALTPHLDEYVQKKIDSGRYQSASEVVRESLRLMEEEEEDRQKGLEELREKIRVGYEQAMRGETVDGETVFAEIRAMSAKARADRDANERQGKKIG